MNEAAEQENICIEQLSLTAGHRPLLRDARLELPRGRITLLVGCSGVGKSLLLKILAGLMESQPGAVEFSGSSARQNEQAGEALRLAPDGGPVGVVFQSFALFDEFSPINNVRIAVDHAPGGKGSPPQTVSIPDVLADLGVPTDRRTSVLSGGQRQRLAIARAVAMNSEFLLYDEPTSGLDIRTGATVAERIRMTQETHQRTALIVTHDFPTLLPIADHVILLDHHQQQLREIPKTDWGRLDELLGQPPAVDTPAPATGRSLPARLKTAGMKLLAAVGQLTEQVLLLPVMLLPLWRNVRWGLRFTRHYLQLVCGFSACVYIAVAGIILGFVTQDFIFRYLPFRQFTEPLLTENLLHATGFALYRFLMPILATILIAARSGAAVAADVGSKVYGNQLDAMKTFGMSPERSLRTPVLYAFLIGTPFLSLLGYASAAITAAVAFLATHAEEGIAFWDAHFHHELHLPDQLFYKGSGFLLTKLLACGTGIALIAWNCGRSPKHSGPEISHGVTRTILWSTLYVLFIHFLWSLFEFKAPQ